MYDCIIFCFVLSIKSFVLFWISSTNSVVGVICSYGLFPSLWSNILYGTRPWDTLVASQPILAWKLVLWFRTANGKYLCHCGRSKYPIVCGCSVVAHLRVIPKICVISAMIVEVNAVPLSLLSVVGRYACLVIISMSTFATLMAEASVRG